MQYLLKNWTLWITIEFFYNDQLMKFVIFSRYTLMKFAIFYHDKLTKFTIFPSPIDKIHDFSLRPMDQNSHFFPWAVDETPNFYPSSDWWIEQYISAVDWQNLPFLFLEKFMKFEIFMLPIAKMCTFFYDWWMKFVIFIHEQQTKFNFFFPRANGKFWNIFQPIDKICHLYPTTNRWNLHLFLT